MESHTASTSESSSTSTIVGSLSGTSQFREKLSITSTPLNGRIMLFGIRLLRFNITKFHYLTDNPWIHIDLWNSMNLILVALWFSYELPNLCGVRLRRCIMVLIISVASHV